MAKIVLGMCLSHTPQLHTPASAWDVRVEADRRNRAHRFRGGTYDWDALCALRREEHLEEKIGVEQREARLLRCHKWLDHLAQVYRRVRPDVAVIVGNDQHELFDESVMPAFTVYWGETIANVPRSEAQVARLPAGIHIADHGHVPPQTKVHPGLPALGGHIIDSAIREGFDVAQARTLHQVVAERSILSGIPHAYGFVYRQIMQDEVIPNVPIILNTFYPPNQPTVRRCFEFGRCIGNAIAAWPQQLTVAVFGSGGLSHFVVDPQFDHAFLQALADCDVQALAAPGEPLYQSGTSECKNWITAAGVLSTAQLRMQLHGYEPLFRSEAGTGTGAAFASWQ